MASRAVEAINAHRNALLLREQAAMQVQARAWLGVEAELNRAAVPLIEQARQGNLSRDQIQRLERYRALMNQTSTQLKGYESFMEEQVRDGQRTAASMAIDHAVGAINASAQEAGMMAVQFNRLPVAAVENMVGLTTTGSPLSSVLADASRGAPERLGQELINSIALGRNPIETARLAVRRGLGPTFTRMRTIARTEQLRVYRQVSLATYSHSGVVDEYRRLSARDSRVCPACLFADGRTYPISKPFAEHPQGRCTTIPVIRGHKTPEFETGEQWFKKQNVETQKKILGNTRYDLWKGGKVKQLGDFIEETHNEDWGDSMTTRSLHDVLGHRPVRPDRLPSVVDQYNSSVFSSSSGVGPAEMGENDAIDWQEDSMIRGDLWTVKTSKSGEKIRKEGFGNTVFLDIDTDEAVKKAQAMPGSDLIRVKVKVQNPAYVQINPMSSSKDIAEKFFGEPLEKLQRDTGKTDVYEIFRAKGYDSLRLMPSSGKKGMMVIFDPGNAVPVRKFDVGGPNPPKPKPKPKVEWKPTMTKEEADSWAEDSQHLGDIYVVKASSNAAKDRSFGFVGNVQALTDEEAANKKAATGGEKMVVRARVTNVATYRGTAASSSKDIAEGVFGKPLHELQKETGEKDVYAIFKAKGYDAIKIDTPSGKNGMLIVLDPKKTTIVTDGVSKPPSPPKPPPTPPKPPPPPPKPTPSSGGGWVRGPQILDDGTYLPKGYTVVPETEIGHDQIHGLYKPWKDSWTKEEKHAVGVYYGAGSGRINGDLRAGRPFIEPSDKEASRLLDQVLDRSSVPDNLVVYRGMYNPTIAKAIDRESAMDLTFKEKGYTSTSTSKKVATKFTTPDSDSILAEIRLPKGSKGGLISPDYSSENEILLPKGTEFRVVAYRYDLDLNKKVVTLEIVPSEPETPKVDMSAEKKKRLETPKSQLTPKYRTPKHGFYVDDDEVIQTKSIKEVETLLAKRYPSTVFDFKGMDLEIAQTTADEYHRLAQKYPEVARELTYIGTYEGKPPKHLTGFGASEKDTIAHAGTSGKYIGFNPKYYGDAEKLKKANRNSAYTGWTVQHGEETYTPLTHEFGHQVEHYYYNQGVQKSLTGTVGISSWESGDKSRADGRTTPGTMTHIVEEFNKWTSPSTSLSRYATTTNNNIRKEEGWSEAFIKAEVYPEEDWDDYTKAHRQLITVVPPTTKGLKEKSTAKRLSELSPEQQKTERGKLQDLYRKAGVLFRG